MAMTTRSQAKSQVSSSGLSTQSTTTRPSASISSYATTATISRIEEDIPAKSKITVVSWLQLLLDPVLKCGTLGNSSAGLKNSVNLDVDAVCSSAPRILLEKTGHALGDQVRLSISYADTFLKWTFAFCWLDPSLPPDIIFDDENFEPNYMTYKEFRDWNPRSSSDCFLNLLRRLFADYREYQVQSCMKHSRIEMDIGALKQAGFADDSYDVYAYEYGGRKGDVVFIFSVRADAVDDLPAKYLTETPVDARVVLKIRFTSFGDGKAHADVELTPFFNRLFNAKSLKLPAMTSLICEYVHEVQEILNDEVSVIGVAFKFKRDLISALSASYPSGSLLGYDPEMYTKAAFLLDHQDFKFICKVNFAQKFPFSSTVVQVSLSSIYHEVIKEPPRGKKVNQLYTFISTIAAIKPQSTIEETVQKIRSHIEEKIVDFKRKSCQEGR